MVYVNVIIICVIGIKTNMQTQRIALIQNKSYEDYLQKEIYGTDVTTLINKAISDNENNKVPKDEKENYINNEQNSIQIDIVMITNQEKGKTQTYKMETINKVGITEFIKNFNTAKFKCSQIKYHNQTGKIAYIEIAQLED